MVLLNEHSIPLPKVPVGSERQLNRVIPQSKETHKREEENEEEQEERKVPRDQQDGNIEIPVLLLSGLRLSGPPTTRRKSCTTFSITNRM